MRTQAKLKLPRRRNASPAIPLFKSVRSPYRKDLAIAKQILLAAPYRTPRKAHRTSTADMWSPKPLAIKPEDVDPDDINPEHVKVWVEQIRKNCKGNVDATDLILWAVDVWHEGRNSNTNRSRWDQIVEFYNGGIPEIPFMCYDILVRLTHLAELAETLSPSFQDIKDHIAMSGRDAEVSEEEIQRVEQAAGNSYDWRNKNKILEDVWYYYVASLRYYSRTAPYEENYQLAWANLKKKAGVAEQILREIAEDAASAEATAGSSEKSSTKLTIADDAKA